MMGCYFPILQFSFHVSYNITFIYRILFLMIMIYCTKNAFSSGSSNLMIAAIDISNAFN